MDLEYVYANRKEQKENGNKKKQIKAEMAWHVSVSFVLSCLTFTRHAILNRAAHHFAFQTMMLMLMMMMMMMMVVMIMLVIVVVVVVVVEHDPKQATV